MARLSNRTAEAIESASFVGSAIVGVLFIFLPLADQVLEWLKTGTIPSRDLFWVFAPVSCAATGGKAMGFDGMTLCRPDRMHFTDWVGVDRILNYVFDMNIAAIAGLGLFFVWWLVIAIIYNI